MAAARYDGNWHRILAGRTEASASRILGILARHFSLASAIDVGCGHGHWLAAARDLGIDDVVGLDGPWNTDPGLPADRFRTVDFEQDWSIERRFDLALCLEVAEHISIARAPALVQALTAASDLVLFSAAIPYQGGFRHINEQWPSWWACLFASHGFEAFDVVRPVIWADSGVHVWYRQNVLLYCNRENRALVGAAERAAEEARDRRLDVVHPEKFTELASYRAIAFRPFLRAFPGAVMRKLLSRFRVG